MKKTLIVFVAILQFVLTVNAQVSLLGGSGTSGDPYKIGSVDELKFFRDKINANDATYDVPGRCFKLTSDIDMGSEPNWTPIGSSATSTFTGIFDGNNKIISNLKNGTAQSRSNLVTNGLFGVCFNATILNTHLRGVAIYMNSSTNVASGALMFNVTGTTVVNNCSSEGLIDVAYSGASLLSAGGLSAKAEMSGIIINSYSNVNLKVVSTRTATAVNVGALVGLSASTTSIKNNYARGKIDVNVANNSPLYAGGILGSGNAGVYNCYSSSIISAKGVSGNVKVGGIVGQRLGNVMNCIALNPKLTAICSSGTITICRITDSSSTGSLGANYAKETMELFSGTTGLGSLVVGVVSDISGVQGENLNEKLPVVLLQAWASNSTNLAPTGTSWSGWSVITPDVYPVLSTSSLPTSVVLQPESLTLAKGENKVVNALVLPGSASQNVIWSSTDETIVTVTSSGKIAGINEGVTTVKATTADGSLFALCNVRVNNETYNPVTGISFDNANTSLLTGNTFQLNPLVLPVNATNKKVIYSTTNSAVATVNEAGLITGVSRGTAKISAKTEDGNFTAVFTVSVYSNALTLGSLISNNMVLQQNTEVALWGWTSPNASVEINGSWGQSVTTTADETGKWMKKIKTPVAVKGDNQPKYTLTFTGPANTVSVQNILIGDVYLCSGQSNMLFPMKMGGPSGTLGGVDNYTSEILLANYPNIRYNKVDGNVQPVPVDYRSSSWTECNPTNAQVYSAVAYYFAKELYDDSKINIPIGLIVSAVGATRGQGWTSREAMAADPILKSTYLDPYDQNPTLDPSAKNAATILYNGGIAPLIPFTINGFLWYQGEGNVGETTYTRLSSAMINDWRARWGQGNLPFYFVQIAPYSNAGANSGITREQQTNTLVLPGTGMAVTTDITADLINIHPTNKKDVGKRLALWAKAKIYGEDIVYTGPMYKSMKVEGNKIRISFHPASIGSGLEVIGGGTALNEFSIGGADNIMVAADAVIDGNDVLVSAATVPNPTNVWFAYKKDPLSTLRNKEGLPASPFRTNGWDTNIIIPFNQISASQTPKSQSIKISRMNETLNISGFPIGQTMRIYNLLGIEVYASKVTTENISLSIPKGIYLLKELGSPFLVP